MVVDEAQASITKPKIHAATIATADRVRSSERKKSTKSQR
jgi:hypothetical protein